MSKTAITIRVEAALLAAARQRAEAENRTLTNYIETLLKQAVCPRSLALPSPEPTLTTSLGAASQPILIPAQINSTEEEAPVEAKVP